VRGRGEGLRMRVTCGAFIASVSSPSDDWFIANPFSGRRINHSAALRSLCLTVYAGLEFPAEGEKNLLE